MNEHTEIWGKWINPLTGQEEIYRPQTIIIENQVVGNPEEYWGKFIAWLNFSDPIPGGHQALMGSIERYKKIYLEANAGQQTIHLTEEEFKRAVQEGNNGTK